jgi:hypothetical protein
LENKRVEQVLPGSGVMGRSGKVAQTMNTHVSKCENNKRKERKKSTCNLAKYIDIHV